ncbi:hypothetical protein M569_14654 [Genlisea aurea]|uniref:DEK-C domain-containing protein n=1 Tax=Genlisea aurea TaxID=192259 RepID=S8BZW4_9LAMI|nr:hypothetical protein M569_14654 [Genlisea aurea]
MPTSKQSVAKERTGGSSGKKAAAVNAKKDKKIAEKIKPSDDELKNAVCEILKEVDFNTATFTDILKLLAKKFDVDLAPRKAGIKLMIQEELTKLADAEDDEEEEEEEEEEAAEGEEDGKRKAVKV